MALNYLQNQTNFLLVVFCNHCRPLLFASTRTVKDVGRDKHSRFPRVLSAFYLIFTHPRAKKIVQNSLKAVPRASLAEAVAGGAP
jgi:hypothetical protein